MRNLLLNRRIIIGLCLFLSICPVLFGQDQFDVYDVSMKNKIEDRVKLEIDRISTMNISRYQLVITGARLKIRKGFEPADGTLRQGGTRSVVYDLSSFTLTGEEGDWLVYTPNQLAMFSNVYTVNETTGDIALAYSDLFFYANQVRIAPIKTADELYSVFNYYVPGSASMETDGGLLVSGKVNILEKIRFIDGGTPLSIRQDEGSELSFQELSVEGADLSLLSPEERDFFRDDLSANKISLVSGSMRFTNTGMQLTQFDMTGGTLVMENLNKAIQSLSASGGSISYKNLDYPVTTIDISGDVTIENTGDGLTGYLAKTVNIKDAVVTVKHTLTDTSCGASMANPIASDTIMIDGGTFVFQNVRLSDLPSITISGNSNVEMTDVSLHRDTSTEPIHLTGGTLQIDNSSLSGNESLGYIVEQEDGLLQIKDSFVDMPILLKGSDAKAEFISGYYEGYRKTFEVENGSLEVQGGDIQQPILMRGGSLDISGGFFNSIVAIEVAADCDITLRGGTAGPSTDILYHEGATVPASSSLLAAGYIFGEDYIGSIYPSGKNLTIKDAESIFGDEVVKGKKYSFSAIVPDSYTLVNPAYEAARVADVGPDGKDVRVNGTTFEILTPAGLAWIAVKSYDGVRKLDNGDEYYPASFRMVKTFKLADDLDMEGYGDNWPSINLGDNILDGQGHRVYNLNLTGSSSSLIGSISQNGVLANLLVEGSILLNKRRFGISSVSVASGVCYGNSGLIVNCAYKGAITTEMTGHVCIGGLVGMNMETGRIENCYVNPCGERVGGIRPASVVLNGNFPCNVESMDVAKLVGSNQGIVMNCYFAGKTYFDNQVPDNPNIQVQIHQGFVGDWNGDFGTVTNCYAGSDISLKTLNENVQNHQQDPVYPWVNWEVDPDNQCGMPYLLFTGGITPSGNIIITGEEPYKKEHEKKNVIVRSGAIYTVADLDASIASLTIEEGGQVRLRKALRVADSLIVKRYIETDLWTTFCAPENMMVTNNLDINVPAGQEAIWSKTGYTALSDQRWNDYGASNVIKNRAHLYVARHESQMGHFYSVNAPVILEAVAEPVAPGNVPNGNWFHFVANPYWENLPIEGRAYVLNEAGTSFDLQENPVIPPFHCYMVASEEVMNNVSSLRLSGIPTSLEEIEESSFRVWTERGTVCVEAADEKDVTIYSVTGVAKARFDKGSGVRRIALPAGIYLVVHDGKVVKVVL
uniref:DUF6383 domain-containing protein n=1 Tax=Parabacteroides distasonis TaxID=823 RepID=UPI00402571C9